MKRNARSNWGTPTPKRNKNYFSSPYSKSSGSASSRSLRSRKSSSTGKKTTNPMLRMKRRVLFRQRVKVSRSVGFYRGKIKANKRPRKGVMMTCMQKGYHLTGEIYGRISDGSCVYLTHSTYHMDDYCRVIAGAMIRKLLQKAGFQISSPDEVINFSGVASSSDTSGANALNTGYRLLFRTINEVTGVQQLAGVVGLSVTSSLNNIVTNFTGLFTYLQTYLRGQATGIEPYELELRCGDAEDAIYAVFQRSLAILKLENEVVNLHVVSELTIQNRTSPQTATTSDAQELDRIDNQPLTGVLYQFKHGNPRLKYTYPADDPVGTQTQLQQIYDYGVRLIKSSELASGSSNVDFQEVPKAGYFNNVAKTTKVNLDPGIIKRTSIVQKYVGKMNNIMKKMRVQQYEAQFLAGVPGKSEMFILQERLRTDSTNPITVQYQRNLKLGCYLVTKGTGAPLITTFATAVYNNT